MHCLHEYTKHGCRPSKWELYMTKSARKKHFHSSRGWWFANNVVKHKGPWLTSSNGWWHKRELHEDQDRLQKLWCCCHLRFCSGNTTLVWKGLHKNWDVDGKANPRLISARRASPMQEEETVLMGSPKLTPFPTLHKSCISCSQHTLLPARAVLSSSLPHQPGPPPCLVLAPVLLQPPAETDQRRDSTRIKGFLDCI